MAEGGRRLGGQSDAPFRLDKYLLPLQAALWSLNLIRLESCDWCHADIMIETTALINKCGRFGQVNRLERRRLVGSSYKSCSSSQMVLGGSNPPRDCPLFYKSNYHINNNFYGQ